MKFVNITTEGNLFVSQPIMDCIRSYFYDLCSQVRTKLRQEFPFGERSARATVQAFQWIFREEIRKHYNCHDEESFKGLVWRQSIVKEFLCLVKERSDQLIQYETATGSVEVNLDFRNIHGDLQEDLSCQMMRDILFSLFVQWKTNVVLFACKTILTNLWCFHFCLRGVQALEQEVRVKEIYVWHRLLCGNECLSDRITYLCICLEGKWRVKAV